jgi:hypothetical protein
LVRVAAYYFARYCYYGGGRVSALRFLYKVRYAVGLYDHAMRGAIQVGDLVQVEIGGAFQLEMPKRVRAIQDFDGKPWVFVDDHEAGVPMEQIQVIEKGAATPVEAAKAPRLALPAKDDDGAEKIGVRKSRFPLAEGDVVVTFPENLSADSVEDLDGFWQVFIKKARREAGPKQ